MATPIKPWPVYANAARERAIAKATQIEQKVRRIETTFGDRRGVNLQLVEVLTAQVGTLAAQIGTILTKVRHEPGTNGDHTDWEAFLTLLMQAIEEDVPCHIVKSMIETKLKEC
jgi:hypothetical protein